VSLAYKWTISTRIDDIDDILHSDTYTQKRVEVIDPEQFSLNFSCGTSTLLTTSQNA